MAPSVDETRYYNAQFKWKEVPLQTDSLKSSVFYPQIQRYAKVLDRHLPTVPEILPLCQFDEPRVDSYNSGGAQRVDVTSYILEPKYWTIQLELEGQIMGGNDVPEKYHWKEKGEEEWTLDASIELEGSLGVEGSYGVLKYSANVKGRAGASWKKKVITSYEREGEIDGKKMYQTIKLRPRLVSRVKSSYRTSLLIDPKRFGVAITKEGREVSNDEKLEQNSKIPSKPNADVATAADAFGKAYSFRGKEPQVDEGLTWKTVHHFFLDTKFLPKHDDAKLLVWYKRHKHVDKYPWINSSDSFDQDISVAKNYSIVEGVKSYEEKIVHDFEFGRSFQPWKVVVEIV